MSDTRVFGVLNVWRTMYVLRLSHSHLQNRTATKSVSSMIFCNILALTSSMRSGKSMASKEVRKSSTPSSSMRSPSYMMGSFSLRFSRYGFDSIRSCVLFVVGELPTWSRWGRGSSWCHTVWLVVCRWFSRSPHRRSRCHRRFSRVPLKPYHRSRSFAHLKS